MIKLETVAYRNIKTKYLKNDILMLLSIPDTLLYTLRMSLHPEFLAFILVFWILMFRIDVFTNF